MVLRGIVQQLTNNGAIVRIPTINHSEFANDSTPIRQLYTATISCDPGIFPRLRINDAVWVAFENDDISKPVIIGVLFIPNKKGTVSDATLDSLIINVDCKLPKDTTIGKVSSDSLSYIENLKSNAQKQLDNLSIEIDNPISNNGLKQRIKKLEDNYLKNPIILQKDISYGNILPSNPVDGQLFLLKVENT